MKKDLIVQLNELLEETDKVNFVGIKVSIMLNTQFLAKPKTLGEISNIMEVVSSYIDSPNEETKDGVRRLIERIETKF